MSLMRAASLVLVFLVLAARFQEKRSPSFDPPVRLKAGDAFIDVGEEIGYAGPQVFDVDGDARLDLVVGNFRGHFLVFKNIGTNESRVFEAKGRLKADGKEVAIHNW
jgi:hypothetical protein